jgi:hypothetical protein
VLWAIPTTAALVAGRSWLALWLAPVAGLAAAGLARSWSPSKRKAAGRSRGRAASGDRRPPRAPRARPPAELAAVLAAAIVLASVAGPVPAAALAVLVAGLLARPAVAAGRSPGPVRSALLVLAPAGAGAGVVVTRGLNLTSAIVLLAMVWAYDASAYIVGTGARHRWAGPLAGVASVAAVSLLVAAVLAPPFRGTAPWLMGGLAAVLAPLGPALTARLQRSPSGRLPGPAGRLDSLVLLAPAWATASALLLKS